MKKVNQQLRRSISPGFTIMEVVIALGIVSVGLVAIVGVLPVGIEIANETSERFGATGWVEAAFEDVRSVPAGSPEGTLSPRYEIPLPEPGQTTMWTGYFSDGGRETEPENAVWTVEITLSRPAIGQPGPWHIHGRARWPAIATGGFERGRVHLTTAFAK
jgi:type II secretory pathway pseudopilin PulG